jgi:hypothetical protein
VKKIRSEDKIFSMLRAMLQLAAMVSNMKHEKLITHLKH